MWKGVNMTGLESGDWETHTRSSMRRINSISSSPPGPTLLALAEAELLPCLFSTWPVTWKLFLSIPILALLLPHSAIKIWLISKQSVIVLPDLLSAGRSDSMSWARAAAAVKAQAFHKPLISRHRSSSWQLLGGWGKKNQTKRTPIQNNKMHTNPQRKNHSKTNSEKIVLRNNLARLLLRFVCRKGNSYILQD